MMLTGAFLLCLQALGGPTSLSTPTQAATTQRLVTLIAVSAKGDTGCRLPLVVTRVPGTGRRVSTGNMGLQFKEAGDVAISLVGARLGELGRYLDSSPVIEGGALEMSGWDIHIALPSAGGKKDGCSGGLGMFMALVAMTFGMEVVENTGFTGEVDFYGSVIAVGDIEQKLAMVLIFICSRPMCIVSPHHA